MALNSVYRVRTRGRLRGQRVEFGLHIRQILPGGGPADLAASWTANIMPLIDAATPSAINWEDIVVTDTSDTGDEQVEVSLTQPHPGTLVGDPLPNQNAIVVGWRTGQKGRRKRGRWYLPGPMEVSVNDGVLVNPQLLAVQNLAQAVITFYGPSGSEAEYRAVVYSPPTPPFKPKVAPPVHTDTLVTQITTHNIDEVVRTQRRRSIGVGE